MKTGSERKHWEEAKLRRAAMEFAPPMHVYRCTGDGLRDDRREDPYTGQVHWAMSNEFYFRLNDMLRMDTGRRLDEFCEVTVANGPSVVVLVADPNRFSMAMSHGELPTWPEEGYHRLYLSPK
jgi:hypothetical protein